MVGRRILSGIPGKPPPVPRSRTTAPGEILSLEDMARPDIFLVLSRNEVDPFIPFKQLTCKVLHCGELIVSNLKAVLFANSSKPNCVVQLGSYNSLMYNDLWVGFHVKPVNP